MINSRLVCKIGPILLRVDPEEFCKISLSTDFMWSGGFSYSSLIEYLYCFWIEVEIFIWKMGDIRACLRVFFKCFVFSFS